MGSQDDSDEEDSEFEEESEGGGGSLVFPQTFCKALGQLLLTDKPVAVKDLKLDDKEERVGLAYSLWAEGFVSTVASKPLTSKKQKT